MIQQVFRRSEIKYVLSQKEYHLLMDKISPYLEKDEYFKETNCSIYFDNDSNWLAIHSLEKPMYKEKIRIRSYNVPTLTDTIFVEIKKKYDGVGSKRRIPMKLCDFYLFLKNHQTFNNLDENQKQILSEIEYVFKFYNLKPTLYLAYDRLSYCDKNNPNFRVTFDHNVRSRKNNLRLEAGDNGKKYFKNNEVVMEVKALGSYPIWFVKSLSSLKIYPASFSKYGCIMQSLDRKS